MADLREYVGEPLAQNRPGGSTGTHAQGRNRTTASRNQSPAPIEPSGSSTAMNCGELREGTLGNAVSFFTQYVNDFMGVPGYNDVLPPLTQAFNISVVLFRSQTGTLQYQAMLNETVYGHRDLLLLGGPSDSSKGALEELYKWSAFKLFDSVYEKHSDKLGKPWGDANSVFMAEKARSAACTEDSYRRHR